MHYNDQGADFKYLIVNERDKRFGLSVTTVGFQLSGPEAFIHHATTRTPIISQPRKDVCCMNISWYISLKDEELRQRHNPVCWHIQRADTFPVSRQWHTHAPLQKTGWNEYYIGFEGPIIDNLVKNSFISKESQILDIGINEELASLFARALEVAEADKTAAQQYLSGIVLHIMGAVLAISQNKRYEVDNAAQKIESAKIIMHENVYKDIDPEELARKLGISYSWFRKVFKEYTGYAPAKYFQELKLRKSEAAVDWKFHVSERDMLWIELYSTEHFFLGI